MTSLPLARVFQCLFTFALVSASRWLAATWQLSRRGATGELEVEFKFHRRRCNLSFFFPPCRHSVPESLLASYPRFNKLTPTKPSLCWDFKISQSKVHTSEVDLELQLMVINFLSLVALTSTIYLQDDINKSSHCESIYKTNKQSKKKKPFYLSVNVFSTKVLIGNTTSMPPTGVGVTTRRGHQSHSIVQPLTGQRKYVYFSLRPWVLIWPRKIHPATSHTAVKRPID